ncbi:hypothetical protein I4U23_012104 [Adineta vaga]|nr:hypothetical protein I4U23_012104 [Adineta vaga]
MSHVNLLDLPVEILHNIFDYLHIKTIFCSLRCSCSQLYNAIKTYKGFELDLTSASILQFECVSQIIHPECATGLIFSARNSQNWDRTNSFLKTFDIQQFIRLRSLTILDIDLTDLDDFLQRISSLPLTSLSIKLHDDHQRVLLPRLTSLIEQGNLRKLELLGLNYSLRALSWPKQCILNHLSITSCTYEEYLTILKQSPFLRTFILQTCFLTMNTIVSYVSYPQLTSLTINQFYSPLFNIKLLLSLTPSLASLKLICHRSDHDPLFNGLKWEEFIQTKLQFLKTFQFCFRQSVSTQMNNYVSLLSIVKGYHTPFWLETKRWFVTCDYVLSSISEIILYTTPVPIRNSKIFIRCNPSSNSYYFAKGFPKDDNDDTPDDKTPLDLDLTNTSKKSLDMRYLACALPQDTTIVSLNLNENKIGSDGIKYLVDGLKNNLTLITLDIGLNPMGDPGEERLRHVFEMNDVLQTLNVENNPVIMT